MRTTMDKAGRIVIPKELRDRIGLVAGEVEIETVDARVTIAPVTRPGRIEDRNGRAVLVGTGVQLTDADIRELRLGLQR